MLHGIEAKTVGLGSVHQPSGGADQVGTNIFPVKPRVGGDDFRG
jgi:hypothetical protein